MSRIYPKLTDRVEVHIGETLAFYRLPRRHHKHLKSTNLLERLNEEIKRRTRGTHLPEGRELRASHPCPVRRDP